MSTEINKVEIPETGQNLLTKEIVSPSSSRAQEDPKRIRVKHQEVLQIILKQLSPISFSEKVDLEDGQKLKKQHYVVESIDQIFSVAENSNWTMSMKNGYVYIFNGEYWKSFEDQETENFLGEAAQRLGINKYDSRYYPFRSDLLKQLKSSTYFFKPNISGDKVLINLQNGTFEFNNDGFGLKDFEASDFIRYQLPFALNDQAECPKFSAFLDQVLQDKDSQDILSEYIAYVFLKQKRLKLEKCLILYGKGANGKSVFFDIINALLGPENVSSFSLQSLTNESGYHRACLGNKLLNYAPEISDHMNSSFFKQLVSGEPVEARLPYGNPFILEDYAKFIFNANELPRDVEQNEAFFRRFIILKFEVTIAEAQRDPKLAQKIIAEELPGVFNWVLRGLKRLLHQERFSISNVANEALNEYKASSDSVKQFLLEGSYESSNATEIPLHDFYTRYNRYSLESGCKPASKRVFADRLRNMDFTITRRNFGNAIGVMKNVP
ncbi:MAG: phage/plasmid primase, P4 family [Ferruginibacter sp.]